MSSTTSQLPPTCRALVCPALGQPLEVQTITTPDAITGSVVVRVLASGVDPTLSRHLQGGTPGLTISTPFIPGGRSVGRVAAVGPDTTSLQVGQLVTLDPFVRGRDDPNAQILWGIGMFGSDTGSKKLLEGPWRNGMSAEYVRAPLENCYPLNEKALLGSPAEGGLGYSVADLVILGKHIVPYGGLQGIGLKPGETIIISPATGAYSGAAVEVASAMGARVIAVGRDLAKLQAVAANNPRINIVQFKGNVEEDLASLQKFGQIDAYLDISPFTANESTHVRSCMMAVKPYGRVSLMGVLMKGIAIPYMMACLKNLTIRGQYMYEREDVLGAIKLAETGILKLGKGAGHEIVGQFALEDWKKATELAEANPGAGKTVVFTP